MFGLIKLKLLLSACLSIMTIIVGLLPVTILRAVSKNSQQSRKISWILTLLACFAGGVILATCFLDVLPHVNHNYAKYRKDYNIKVEFPVPEFVACLGFFLVYFIEEIVIRLFASGNLHAHSHAHGALKEIEVLEPLNSEKHTLNGKSNEDENGHTRKASINVHELIVDECAKNISSEDNTNANFIKSLAFALAMSFHSVLEGFALGVQEDTTGAVTLFFSLLVDNALDAFTVGLQVSRSNSKKFSLLVATVIIYGLTSPAGALAGMFLSNSSSIDPQWRDLAVIILEAVAAGVFIFMTFLEILAHERENSHSNLIQLLAIIVGFSFIASLQASEYFGEGEGHHHG